MVAETKENMTQAFDNMNETFRVAMDAGRRTQETFTRSMNDMWKNPMGFDMFFARGEKMAREFMPFMGRNMETFVDSMDTAFRTNMDVVKTATDTAMKGDDADMYRRSRQVFDAAFGAMRTNFETFAKAGSRTMENFSMFCKNTCMDEMCGRGTAKAAK
jgi:hypothetical protein